MARRYVPSIHRNVSPYEPSPASPYPGVQLHKRIHVQFGKPLNTYWHFPGTAELSHEKNLLMRRGREFIELGATAEHKWPVQEGHGFRTAMAFVKPLSGKIYSSSEVRQNGHVTKIEWDSAKGLIVWHAGLSVYAEVGPDKFIYLGEKSNR